MSHRRFALAAALVLAVTVAVAYAQPQVTVVLTNGQQYAGSLVYRNNTVGVFTYSGLRSFPSRNVAVIEFTPGQPDPNEVSQLPAGTSGGLGGLITSRASSAVLVLRDGSVVTGTLAGISSDGNQITLNTSNGRDNYMASDIARLYLNPAAAQRLFASNGMIGSQGAVGTSGQSPLLGGGRTISVPANTRWTPTGIQVNAGDRVAFRAAGQIHWGPQASQVAGPDGGRGISPNYPVPTAGVGALVGRVGNSQPFAIPTSGDVRMPASGELYLGVNDDNLSDNSGAFSVQVAQIGG